jgi:hypothetical protein
MKKTIFLIIALAAIAAQPITPPPSFTKNIDEATISLKPILGLRWPGAGKFADETMFAGIRVSDGSPQTGP